MDDLHGRDRRRFSFPHGGDGLPISRPVEYDAKFLGQLEEIVDERRSAAEKRQRDEPTQCGRLQHAGFTCREFDAFIRQTIDAGGDPSGNMALMLDEHRGYDPIV